MTTEITKISIRIGDRESDLTIDEARELYEKLKDLFDKKIVFPDPTPFPAQPNTHPWTERPWKIGDYWWTYGNTTVGDTCSVYASRPGIF